MNCREIETGWSGLRNSPPYTVSVEKKAALAFKCGVSNGLRLYADFHSFILLDLNPSSCPCFVVCISGIPYEAHSQT